MMDYSMPDGLAEELQRKLTTPGTTIGEITETANGYCRAAYHSGMTAVVRRICGIIESSSDPADFVTRFTEEMEAVIEKIGNIDETYHKQTKD